MAAVITIPGDRGRWFRATILAGDGWSARTRSMAVNSMSARAGRGWSGTHRRRRLPALRSRVVPRQCLEPPAARAGRRRMLIARGAFADRLPLLAADLRRVPVRLRLPRPPPLAVDHPGAPARLRLSHRTVPYVAHPRSAPHLSHPTHQSHLATSLVRAPIAAATPTADADDPARRS